MNQEDFFQTIGELYAPLSDKARAALAEKLTLKPVIKGEELVREGQYSHKAFFILQGSARAYYLNNGKDVTDWVAFENEFISAIVSFFGDGPSPHYIEALEDGLVLEITREAFEELANEFHDFEKLVRA